MKKQGKKFERDILISKKDAKFYAEILSMTGQQLYDEYGYKRDETFSLTAHFDSNIEVDIKIVICDVEDTLYTEGVLFRLGHEQCCSDPSDELLGEWDFMVGNDTYIVNVKTMEELL